MLCWMFVDNNGSAPTFHEDGHDPIDSTLPLKEFEISSGYISILLWRLFCFDLCVEYNCFAAIRYQVDEHMGDDDVEPLI